MKRTIRSMNSFAVSALLLLGGIVGPASGWSPGHPTTFACDGDCNGNGPATQGPYAHVFDVFIEDNPGLQKLMEGLPDFSTVYIHAPESGEPFTHENDPTATGDEYIRLEGKQHIEIIGVSNSRREKPVFHESGKLKLVFHFIHIQHLTVKNIRFETNNTNSLWFLDVTDVDLLDITHDGTVRNFAIHFKHMAQNILIDRWDIRNLGTDFTRGTPAVQATLALIYNQDASSYGGFSLTTSGAYDKATNSYDWNIILAKLAEYELDDDNGDPWTAEGLQALVDSIRIKSFGVQFTGERDLISNVTIRNGSFDMLPGSLNMNAVNLDINLARAVVQNADANELPAGSGVQIYNNTFRHWGHAAIALSRYADVDIHDNVFMEQTGQPLRRKSMAIHVEFSKDFRVHDNSFAGVRRAVDILESWRRGEVRDNTVAAVREEAMLVRGRQKQGMDALMITGNHFDNEGCAGIWPGETCVGIRVEPIFSLSPGDVSIFDNLIEHTEFGVGILGGEHVTILQNTIRHTDYGVGVVGGNTVDIIQNIFSDIAVDDIFVDSAFTGLLTVQGNEH